MTKRYEIFDQYVELFGVELPMPMCIHMDVIEDAVREAIEKGRVIPEDYDWWGDLPEGADA